MRTRSRIASTIALAIAFAIGGDVLVGIGAAPAEGAVFTVTHTNPSGAGSLGQAILDANANPGVDTIAFDIPEPQCSAAGVCTIHLGAAPADLTDPVFVDGTTQPRYGTAPANVCATADAPSYLRVEITVSQLSDSVFLLAPEADSSPSTFRGLSLAGGDPLHLQAAGAHRVQCNHIGVDGPGTGVLVPVPSPGNPPTSSGVLLQFSAQGAWIGTDGDGIDDVAERNVFGGVGIGVNMNANVDNVIAGNYFGVGADGTTKLSTNLGIFMRQSSGANRVGSDFDGVSDDVERNIIGNCSTGIGLFEWASGNEIAGNWIGIDASGAPAANTQGIFLSDVGTERWIAYNRIEGNGTGIEIDAGSTGTLDLDSRDNCLVGNDTGFLHAGTAELTFESNWWGATDGPSGVGAGSGDAVTISGSGSVDFTPWLRTGCPVPEAGPLGAALTAVGALAGLRGFRAPRS